MATSGGPNIITDGLVLHLDAGSNKSYPGSGTTWYDLSGGSRNYTFTSNITWNSDGYFSFNTGTMQGPPSNSFGFSDNVEHTIFAFSKINTESSNLFFRWLATPNTGTETRAIQTHFPYAGGTFYYDVAGCCGSTQRIYSPSVDDYFNTNVGMAVWRTRTDEFPNRQFFQNTTSVLDSSVNTTATVTWDLTSNATLGNGWVGNLYMFMVYNRALTDAEIQQNYNSTKSRFNL